MDSNKKEITTEQLTFISVGAFIVAKVLNMTPDESFDLCARALALAHSENCPISALANISRKAVEMVKNHIPVPDDAVIN